MATTGLVEQGLLADSLGEFEKVRLLDESWTGYLDRNAGRELASAEMSSLENLAAKLDRAVADCAEYAQQLSAVYEANAETIDALCARILADERLIQPAKAWWEDAIERVGAAELSVRSVRGISRMAPEVRSEISEKLQECGRSHSVPGDLPPRWNCYIGIGATVGLGLVATFATGGVGAVAGGYAVFAAVGSGSYCGAHKIFGDRF